MGTMDMMRASFDIYKTDLISSQTKVTTVKQNLEHINADYARHMSSCNAHKEKLETDKQALQIRFGALSSNPNSNQRLTDAAAKLNSTIKTLKSNIHILKNVSVPGSSSGASAIDTDDPLTWSEKR